MDKKIFNDIIVDQLSKVFLEKKFKKEIKNENLTIFIGEQVAYNISFNTEKSTFELNVCSVSEGKPDENWKKLSEWLFDKENSTKRDAQDIANDFEETVAGPKVNKITAEVKKAKKDPQSHNVDSNFFVNRFVNMFPAIREAFANEKETYTNFRYVTFTRTNIVPEILSLLSSKDKSKINKLGSLLSELYKSGNLDVRGLVTTVILNSIEDEKQIDLLKNSIDENLQKAWKASLIFKGKQIKPEKIKKSNKFFAEALQAQQNKK